MIGLNCDIMIFNVKFVILFSFMINLCLRLFLIFYYYKFLNICVRGFYIKCVYYNESNFNIFEVI